MTACTLILACSLETTGSWILISQPSPRPKRHSCKTILSSPQSQINSISKYSFHLIDHRKCGPIGAVPFDHYNETPQHGGSYLMCLCKHILLSRYEKFRWSQSKFTCSNLNFTIYIWPRCFQYAWVCHAEPCCRYKFRLRLDARYFKLFTFTNDSAPNVISVVFERV